MAGPPFPCPFTPFTPSPLLHTSQVWHNYGFDRHVLSNMGIECRGFAGDTLHMARLLDASRRGSKTYALDSLTSDPKVWGGVGWV